MRNVLRFIASAYGAGIAYIDVDGTLVRRQRMGDGDLDHWMANLMPRPVIFSRLVVCYILHWLGVRLVLWTNRPEEVRWGTMLSLGRHIYIFDRAEFHGSGRDPITGKIPKPYRSKYHHMPTDGPVMDDGDSDFFVYPGSLWVRPI